MKKQKAWMAVMSACVLVLASGCASSPEQPAKEPTAQQPQTPPAGKTPEKTEPNTAPNTQKPTEQPQPATGGQQQQPAPTQPEAGKTVAVPQKKPTPANKNNLTNELILHPSIVIGKTTMDEMIAAYGQPVKTDIRPTPYKVPVAGGSKPVEQIMASFLVNPITGEKYDKPYPFYFTKERKILAAAPVFLLRDELYEKQQKGTATFQDLINSYGKVTRITNTFVQFIDYDHHIALRAEKAADGKMVATITKYDLFYAGQPAALADYEETARLAQKLNEIMGEDKKKR
ncbi:hypothetical protein [Brevibacillus migulae]|uniref:hypothetical protein n=1 Tax=Brevibacillus migulae TaxID=1644114 RepID=UPI00106E2788|nr:hypothetical protein [Brevibacillus migulae]